VKTIHGLEYYGEMKFFFAALKRPRDGVLSDFCGQPEKSAKNEKLNHAKYRHDSAAA